jgi:hypothetical protein
MSGTVADLIDLACLDDFDPYFSVVKGAAVIRQDTYHRLTTGLIAPDREFGEDVRRLVGSNPTDAAAARLGPVLVAVIQRDERIETATVNVTLVDLGAGLRSYRIDIHCTTAAGPFDLVLAIGKRASGETIVSLLEAAA